MAVDRVKNSGTLKSIRFSKQTDDQGAVTADVKIPGNSGEPERLIGRGIGWFGSKTAGDYVKISVVDKDGLKYSAGTIVEKFFDPSVDASMQGSFIPHHTGEIVIHPLNDFTVLICGFYLRIEAQKGDSTQDTFYGNLELSMRP